MEFETFFGSRGYRFKLTPGPNDTCFLEDEARFYSGGSAGWWKLGDSPDGTSQMVAEVLKEKRDAKYSRPVYDAIVSWQIYHFHDTSSTAAMRHYEIVQDKKAIRTDAANIAPFLLKLKKGKDRKAYDEILNAVRMVAPFLNDFFLEPRESGSKQEVNLSWTQKGSDYPMQPYHFSDGTIRFICLVTAKDIVVVNRENGASTFKRLKEEDFSVWLQNYSVGELWTKNVIAGGPDYE